jgi:hypothetical protein
VEFRLARATTRWGEEIRVAGAHPALGSWTAEDALTMITDAENYPQWTSQRIFLDASKGGAITLRYKYVRDRQALDEPFQWEDCISNRKVVIPLRAGCHWVVRDAAFDIATEASLRLESDTLDEEKSADEFSCEVLGLLSGHFCVMGRTPLGTGAFGCVWKVQERLDNSPKAIKIVSKSAMESLGSLEGQDAMMNEVRVHRTVQHPCIVNLLGVHDLASSVALVLELCRGGDLLQIVHREHKLRIAGGGLSVSGARNVTYQLLSALAHLHERHIVHRDVKCENILQLEDADVRPEDATFKLADFGLAARLKSSQKLVERVGSPSTCAPEVIAGKPYAEPADLWSAGATLYTCLLARRMQSRSRPCLGAESLASGPASLLRELTLHETSARPTAQEALTHTWLQ